MTDDEMHHKAAFYAAQTAGEMIDHMEDEEMSKAVGGLMGAVGEMVTVMCEREIPRMMISASVGSTVSGMLVEMLHGYGGDEPFEGIPEAPE